MENAKYRKGKRLLVWSFFKEAWLSITLIFFAIAMIVAAIFFNSQSFWTNKADIRLFNQAMEAYKTSDEIIPDTIDLRSELPISITVKYLQQLTSYDTDKEILSLAFYNLGTLMGIDALTTINGEIPSFTLSDAITNLKIAIRTYPNNEDAKYNLELLERVQEEILKDENINIEDYLSIFLIEAEEAYARGEVNKGY